MDKHLEKALEFSNFKQTFSIKQKTLQEKIDAKLTYGINGGLFKIDQSLLTFVHSLCEAGRSSEVVILDYNQNPILIKDLSSFKDEIFDRYFTSMNEYYVEFQELKKSRSVERLLDV
jgi:hypothetical protein